MIDYHFQNIDTFFINIDTFFINIDTFFINIDTFFIITGTAFINIDPFFTITDISFINIDPFQIKKDRTYRPVPFLLPKGWRLLTNRPFHFIIICDEHSTRDISAEDIGRMLQESKINGGDIMPALAQRWVDQGKEVGLKEGQETEKIEIARKLIDRGIDLNLIAETTGLSRAEIDKLAVKG